MVSKIPPSASKAFKVIQDIVRVGTYDIPPELQGAGAPGNLLERLLNVAQNNYDIPDLKDWEVKFHGGNALLTLFHKDPQPVGIINKIVDAFGWENSKGQISFRHTIKGKSERGFVVDNIGNKITVTFKDNKDIVPYWDNNIILNSIGAKLRRLILVHGKVDKANRKVVYESATGYWDLNMTGICDAIKEGTIYIDFDARTKAERGTALRNHGTKFRIHINDIGVIYENHQLIV